jgi:hypothetical protein
LIENANARGRTMSKMNYWTDKWDLHEDVCPCDVHVNEWIADKGYKNKLIYHFGTGTHHVVGVEQAQNGSGNAVVAITASIEEYQAYIKLVAENAQVAKSYLAYFGDSTEYGGLTDRKVLDLFTDKTKSGGHIIFYTKSMGAEKTAAIIPVWEKEKPVERVGEFKTLLIYRKK